jgi:CRISPR/Cas system type I-B associated protein Csh2 (Cas7 group RAMP superfamily)
MASSYIITCVTDYIASIGEEYIMAEMEELSEGEDADGVKKVLNALFKQYADEAMPKAGIKTLQEFINEMSIQMGALIKANA